MNGIQQHSFPPKHRAAFCLGLVKSSTSYNTSPDIQFRIGFQNAISV